MEWLKLQGLASTDTTSDLRALALRGLAGNVMLFCILDTLMRSAFVAVVICDGATEDRWASGSAQARLVHDAWGSDPPTIICSELLRHVAAQLRVAIDYEVGCVKANLGSTGCYKILPHDMPSLSTHVSRQTLSPWDIAASRVDLDQTPSLGEHTSSRSAILLNQEPRSTRDCVAFSPQIQQSPAHAHLPPVPCRPADSTVGDGTGDTIDSQGAQRVDEGLCDVDLASLAPSGST